MRLPDPERSTAVLIGTSEYRADGVSQLPAVAHNLDELRDVLADPEVGGFARNRCHLIKNPDDIRHTYEALERYAGSAEDTFLVYFAGHGFVSFEQRALHLGLSRTDPANLEVSALGYHLVKEIFNRTPATNRVLILDCCFSGRAARPFMGGDGLDMADEIGIEGTYTLTATSANAAAIAVPGERYTAFTGELISLLRRGVPGGPELLHLDLIYRKLRHTMKLRKLPPPQQLGTNTAHRLALARNVAFRADSADHVSERRRWLPADREPMDAPGTALPGPREAAIEAAAFLAALNDACLGSLTYGPRGGGTMVALLDNCCEARRWLASTVRVIWRDSATDSRLMGSTPMYSFRLCRSMRRRDCCGRASVQVASAGTAAHWLLLRCFQCSTLSSAS
jgi:Caspase domain